MRLNSAVTMLLFGTVLSGLVIGCGGGGGGGSTSTPQVVDKPPTLSLVSPASSPVNLDFGTSKTMTLRVKPDDPDTKNLHMVVTWDYGNVTPADSTVQAGTEQSLTFTPPPYDKLCTITITVSDGEYSVAKTVAVNVTGNGSSENQFAVTSFNVTPNPVTPGSAVTITPAISNPAGKTLTYYWTSASGSLAGKYNPVTTWTAPTTAGIYGVYLQISDGTTTVRSGCLVSASGPSGGLTGTYYHTSRSNNIVSLTDAVFKRADPNINFDWQKLGPGNGLAPSAFGVVWTGYVRCDAAGTYAFRAHVDDGVRMKIMNDAGQWVDVIPDNRENWIDHDKGAWLPAQVIPVTLNGGKWYPIHVEYFQGAADAFIHLYWTVNGGTEQIVPQDVLKAE